MVLASIVSLLEMRLGWAEVAHSLQKFYNSVQLVWPVFHEYTKISNTQLLKVRNLPITNMAQ